MGFVPLLPQSYMMSPRTSCTSLKLHQKICKRSTKSALVLEALLGRTAYDAITSQLKTRTTQRQLDTSNSFTPRTTRAAPDEGTTPHLERIRRLRDTAVAPTAASRPSPSVVHFLRGRIRSGTHRNDQRKRQARGTTGSTSSQICNFLLRGSACRGEKKKKKLAMEPRDCGQALGGGEGTGSVVGAAMPGYTRVEDMTKGCEGMR